MGEDGPPSASARAMLLPTLKAQEDTPRMDDADIEATMATVGHI